MVDKGRAKEKGRTRSLRGESECLRQNPNQKQTNRQTTLLYTTAAHNSAPNSPQCHQHPTKYIKWKIPEINHS